MKTSTKKNVAKTNHHLLIKFRWTLLTFFLITLTSGGNYKWKDNNGKNFKSWEWNEINEDARWSPRAGLQVLNHNNNFYLIGGRTPLDPAIIPVPGASTIWGDVWKSRNFGRTWKNILTTDDENHWPARAYFQAVSKGKYMYVLGGQNFNIIDNPGCEFLGLPPGVPCPLDQIPSSDFFNDVWRSKDGKNWKLMTSHAPWEGRAGLSAVVYKNAIYVMGGSVNDDSSIIGPEGPVRKYFNDVWKSVNGKDWMLLTENAPWPARAGGVAVEKDGFMYLIGGEDGFICNEATPRCPPYYNDVWRTRNGKDWELVTANAEWSARPGHQVVVAQDRLVLFGGFGLGFDLAIPANPMDVWTSNNGKVWKKVTDNPWNAMAPIDIKYDFDAVTVKSKWGKSDAIYTFGGDRETFNFADPLNYLNVDNDVWKFTLANKWDDHHQKDELLVFYQNHPNPFVNYTDISYKIPKDGHVQLSIYNSYGKMIKVLVNQQQNAGKHNCDWDGLDHKGKYVGKGIYFAKVSTGKEFKLIRLVVSD